MIFYTALTQIKNGYVLAYFLVLYRRMALILIILALLFIPDPRYPDNRHEVHAIIFIVQKQRNTPVFLFIHLMLIVSEVQGITEYLKILVIRYSGVDYISWQEAVT